MIWPLFAFIVVGMGILLCAGFYRIDRRYYTDLKAIQRRQKFDERNRKAAERLRKSAR